MRHGIRSNFPAKGQPLAVRAGCIQFMQTQRLCLCREFLPRELLSVMNSRSLQHVLIKEHRMCRCAVISPAVRTALTQLVGPFCDADCNLRILEEAFLHRRHIPAEAIRISRSAKIQKAQSMVRPKMHHGLCLCSVLYLFNIFFQCSIAFC